MKLIIYHFFKTLTNMVLILITVFLTLRVVLKFFSTNPATPFVEWVFTVSNFLMTPFANIAPNINTQTGVLDMVAIITLLVYLIAGYLLLLMVEWITGAHLAEEEYPPVVHYHDIPSQKRNKHLE